MAHYADEHERTAHPAGFRLEDGVLDVRGLGVFTRDGEQMGTVEDLYVDTVEREVRFLDVSAGGFLGLGEKHFLIPVEAVAEIYDDGVTVDHNRERISESLSLNTKVVPHTRL